MIKVNKHSFIRTAVALCVATTPFSNAKGGDAPMNAVDGSIQLSNERVQVNCKMGLWSIKWTDPSAALSEASVTPVVQGRSRPLDADGWSCESRNATRKDRLGEAKVLETIYRHPSGLELTVTTRILSREPTILFTVNARNGGANPLTLNSLALLDAHRGLTPGTCPHPETDLSVYVDSGSQGGTHAAPLGNGQTCAGICALDNRKADLGLVCAFVAFRHDNTVSVKPKGRSVSLDARTTTPVELAPGEAHDYDPLLLSCRGNPFEALERYATVVRAFNHPPIPDRTPMGWISWYCYRLTMTEDTVLENAAVIARHFRKYGVDLIQLDHGWQYRDICGNWVENKKFPHGLPWLSNRLRKKGFQMGLWAAPSVVSEFAPVAKEHPEALVTNPDGALRVIGKRWTWPPHGRTYRVDPLQPAGRQFLIEFANRVNGYGITYLKTDFIGNWGGAVPARTGMSILRDTLDDRILLRPCSTALNILLGYADEIGIARDIGNANGNWKHMRVFTMEVASKWFMHRKFWLNSGGCLIVGDKGETLGEAIGRTTLLALTGGTVLLSDRMPELEAQPKRLALVPLCLPPSDVPARPIDLFKIGRDRDYPRVWHLHAQAAWGQWEVVGLLNWSDKTIQEIVRFTDLGLSPTAECLVFDFWTGTLVGRFSNQCTAVIPAGAARCLRIVPVPNRPAVVGTDMHVTQGLVDLPEVSWDKHALTLSGVAERAPDAAGTVFVWVPEGLTAIAGQQARPHGPRCVAVPIKFGAARAKWTVRFRQDASEAALPHEPKRSVLTENVVRWFGE